MQELKNTSGAIFKEGFPKQPYKSRKRKRWNPRPAQEIVKWILLKNCEAGLERIKRMDCSREDSKKEKKRKGK